MDAILPKRGRGRPRGTGKPDGAALRAIADLLITDPLLKPTTAMKRTIGGQDPSAIRRLQVKWQTEGATLLAEARQREDARRMNISPGPHVADETTWMAPTLRAQVASLNWLHGAPHPYSAFSQLTEMSARVGEAARSLATRSAEAQLAINRLAGRWAQAREIGKSLDFVRASMQTRSAFDQLAQISAGVRATMEQINRAFALPNVAAASTLNQPSGIAPKPISPPKRGAPEGGDGA